MPIALNNIGYRTYFANAIWDIAIIGLIWYYWVETKNLTLEEIDAIFEEKHSNVPDIEQIRTGKATLDVGAVEQELEKKVIATKRG
ncbi:uncharacterized protein LTR77_006448 [Saxophila tyrrhenica]|uniref:Uncharacterized protein n=1 Tax=Saxophila tyrrhenica TaxID=1690608 RepID=A0AAV9P7X4_9PEZI|nr:hypothetical protein LTR77_006448 [Saxophila tyrrhenica]